MKDVFQISSVCRWVPFLASQQYETNNWAMSSILVRSYHFPKLNTVRSLHRLFFCLVVWAYTLGFNLSGTLQAATFNVTKTSDSADGSCDADCSLREAIIAANLLTGMDTIVLSDSTYLLTIGGIEENYSASGDIDVTDDLNINGSTMTNTIIDGGGIDRVLHVDPFVTGVEVNITNLTITNGSAPNESIIANRSGGGIDNRGILNLTNVIVKNNHATIFGTGGGLFNAGILALLNSSIVDNSSYSGGGIGNTGNMSLKNSIIYSNVSTGSLGSGGGISNSGNINIIDCTISSNTARVGGGIVNNNLASFKTDILNSTISGNTATLSVGGGISNKGILNITNSTLSANICQTLGGGIYNDNLLSIKNVTIVGNNTTAGEGGGVYNSGAAEIENSIVANNTAADIGNNCVPGTNFSDWGYNIENINTCGFTNTGDIINTDPLLGSLKDNGGLTFTHELLAGSPSIDAGNPNGCWGKDPNDTLTTDQRGFIRPIDGNGDDIAVCDIGAYEFGSILLVKKGDLNNSGEIGIDDAILALQIISNIEPPFTVYKEADINGDEKIGLAEAIYALQVFAGLTFTQEDLEGIWNTVDRYFFIDDTGQLINVEPISIEVIYNFSGAFAVENKNVLIGTINLDHQHSGGTRHDHDINFSGLTVNYDEIDVDWNVPGAGTGSGTWRRVLYAGSTEQGLIDAENALVLVTGTEQSINPVDNTIIYYLTGTTTNVDEVTVGSCGGNSRINGIIDSQTGEFSGTHQYNNFCDEDTGEFTLNGPAEFTGFTNLESHQPFRYQYYFKDVSFDQAGKSFSINGRKGFNFTISPRSMILSYVFTDKTTDINYWLKDYINWQTHVANYGDISSAIGRYYDPDYGYVEISVGETIRKYDAEQWPSSGKLILTGAVGSKGGNTKIRLTYRSAMEYLVEADTDGDGAYDEYNSGTLFR